MTTTLRCTSNGSGGWPTRPRWPGRRRWSRRKSPIPTNVPDTLLLLEHEPVYTIGRTPDRSSLLVAVDALPHRSKRSIAAGRRRSTGRGNSSVIPSSTSAGAGATCTSTCVSWRTCSSPRWRGTASTGAARGADGRVGGQDRKIASIGVGVRRWVSLHGFAVNVVGGDALANLFPGDYTPCGLAGVRMTAVEDGKRRSAGWGGKFCLHGRRGVRRASGKRFARRPKVGMPLRGSS